MITTNLIGHHHIYQFLKKSNEAGKVSHAYLFFGPERVGKKTVALEFIKLLNCQEKNVYKKPCQSCQFCKDIQKESHPDLIVIEPVKKEIQISQIRNLSWKLSLRSYSASFKTAIIDEAHLMNREAQSALLKTLEEPRGQTAIILITAFPELLLSTIVSRTERIRFSPVAKEEIEGYLKQRGVSKEKSDKLLSISLGRLGEIIDFLDNPQKLEERDQKIKELENLISSPLSYRFQYAKKKAENPQALKEIFDVWLRYFRDKLFFTLDGSSEKYSLKKLKKVINLIQDINFLISKTEVNRRLALEILLLEL